MPLRPVERNLNHRIFNIHKRMPRFVCTIKMGANGAAITARDVETGETIGFNIFGPRELVERLARALFRPPDVEVKWE